MGIAFIWEYAIPLKPSGGSGKPPSIFGMRSGWRGLAVDFLGFVMLGFRVSLLGMWLLVGRWFVGRLLGWFGLGFGAGAGGSRFFLGVGWW